MDDGDSEPVCERPVIDLASLSEREREVLGLALTGLSARNIAERLTLSEATVRSHLSRIYAKVGVSGRIELLAQLNGRSPDEVAGSSPSVETRSPRLRRRRWIAFVVVLLALSAGLTFVVLRPDLPPATDLVTVSQLVSEGQVTSLDLRGGSLFVTTADGRHYRVDGADEAAVRAMQAQAIAASDQVSVSSGGDSLVTSLAILATSLAPLVLLLLVLLLTLRWLRRPPQPRPTG